MAAVWARGNEPLLAEDNRERRVADNMVVRSQLLESAASEFTNWRLWGEP